MNFINLILYIAITGFIVFLIGLIPMPQIFRQLIYGISVLMLILFLLQAFGVAHIPYIHIEKFK